MQRVKLGQAADQAKQTQGGHPARPPVPVAHSHSHTLAVPAPACPPASRTMVFFTPLSLNERSRHPEEHRGQAGTALPQVPPCPLQQPLESSVLCGKRKECWLWSPRVTRLYPPPRARALLGRGWITEPWAPGRIWRSEGSEVAVPHLWAARMDSGTDQRPGLRRMETQRHTRKDQGTQMDRRGDTEGHRGRTEPYETERDGN